MKLIAVVANIHILVVVAGIAVGSDKVDGMNIEARIGYGLLRRPSLVFSCARILTV